MHPFCGRAYRASLRIGALCIAISAQAQTAPSPSGELTLSQAVAATLVANPELRAGEFALRAGEGRVQQAGLRLNPEIALELENFAGSGETSGTDALESTLTLSQVIELGDKRDRRQQVASYGLEVLAVQRQIQQLDVLAEVTQRYLQVVLAQERLALSQKALGLADQTLTVTSRRVNAARSAAAEKSRAEIAQLRGRLNRSRAQQDLQAARSRLASMWGDEQAGFEVAVAELYTLPTLEPIDSLTPRLLQSPDFLRYATDKRLHQAELQLARARSRPSLQLSAGLRRFEESDDTALVAGVSMPIPLFNRQQGERVEHRSLLAKSEADLSAAHLRARVTLSALHGELSVTRDEVATLRGDMLPRAERALGQIRSGFERGRFSYLELVSAQQDVLDTQHAAIEAAGTAHLLHTEIERLIGAPLVHAKP